MAEDFVRPCVGCGFSAGEEDISVGIGPCEGTGFIFGKVRGRLSGEILAHDVCRLLRMEQQNDGDPAISFSPSEGAARRFNPAGAIDDLSRRKNPFTRFAFCETVEHGLDERLATIHAAVGAGGIGKSGIQPRTLHHAEDHGFHLAGVAFQQSPGLGFESGLPEPVEHIDATRCLAEGIIHVVSRRFFRHLFDAAGKREACASNERGGKGGNQQGADPRWCRSLHGVADGMLGIRISRA